MVGSLREYLAEHPNRGSPMFTTHISIDPKGSYIIEDYTTFLPLYKEAIASGARLHIAECFKGEFPPVFDIDLHVPFEGEIKELYTQADVEAVTRAIIECFKTKFTIEPRLIVCVFLAKPPYVDGGVLKHGFHLHFPGFLVKRQAYDEVILPFLNALPPINGQTPSQYIDRKVVHNNWIMYGGCKPGCEPYVVQALYDHEMSVTSVDAGDNVIDLLSVRLTEDKPSAAPKEPIRPTRIHDGPRAEIESEDEDDEEVVHAQRILSKRDIVSLVDILSPQRASDYNDWYKVGCALYNTNQDYFDIWIAFSKRCPEKFDEQACKTKWSAMRTGGVTIGTIRMMAQEDDEDGYLRWKGGLVDRVPLLLNPNKHMKIAKFVKLELPDELMFVGKDEWHIFSDHIWTRIDTDTAIDEIIYPRLGSLVGKFIPVEDENDGEEDEGEPEPKRKKKPMTIREMVMATHDRIQSYPYYHGQLLPALRVAYHGKNRGKVQFNQSRTLFACENGVWDFDKMIFRNGRQSDLLSVKTHVPYKEPTASELSEFNRIIETIFTKEDLREYVLDNVAELLIGGNHRKLMMFFLGRAHAGKSLFTHMISDMLGEDYATTLPISLLTCKRPGQGQATPELTKLSDGLRWFTMNEPDPSDTLKIGTLKELTGDDEIYVRALYGNGKTAQPMCKFAYVSNYLPRIQGVDEATAARVRVINFESRFVAKEECKPTYEEQLLEKIFPVIFNIRDRVRKLAHVFLWTSIERIKKMHAEGRLFRDVNVPSCVTISSRDFILDNDPVKQFCKTLVFGRVTDGVTADEIYSRYDIWFEKEHGKSVRQSLSKRELITRLEKIEKFHNSYVVPESPSIPKTWRVEFAI